MGTPSPGERKRIASPDHFWTMPDCNETFLADPERFAKLHALYPLATEEVEAHALESALAGSIDRFAYSDIDEDHEVFFCDIRKSTATEENQVFPDSSSWERDARNQENYFVMFITREPVRSTSFPVYYLPWKRNSGLRMRLRANTGLRASAQKPHFFITAALQGCGVFVDGTPARPTVYHLNVIAREPNRELARLHAELESRFEDDHTRGDVHLETLPRSYMPLHETPGLDNAQKYGWYNPVGWVFPRWNVQTAQRGTVFGRFEDGEWHFFEQSRTFVRYTTYNWPGVKSPSWSRWSPFSWSETQVRQWVVNRTHQFWPRYRGI